MWSVLCRASERGLSWLLTRRSLTCRDFQKELEKIVLRGRRNQCALPLIGQCVTESLKEIDLWLLHLHFMMFHKKKLHLDIFDLEEKQLLKQLSIMEYFIMGNTVHWLLYGCTTWTLTKRLEKKLDGNYTRMLRAILNKSWLPASHHENYPT